MELPDPVYDITGDGNPSPNGEYYYAGIANGLPYYRRSDSAYFIWSAGDPAAWKISIGVDDIAPGHWHRDGIITGGYLPAAPYAGNPVVAAH